MSLSFQGGGYQAAPDPRAREAGPAARQADARHPLLGEAERAEEVEGDGGGAGQLRQPGHRGRQVRASRRPGDLLLIPSFSGSRSCGEATSPESTRSGREKRS